MDARELQRLLTALFLAGVALLQIADLVTTVAALNLGGTEQNPLMGWMIAEWGTVALFAAKALLAAVFIGLAVTVDHWHGESQIVQAGAIMSLLIMIIVVAGNSAAIAAVAGT